MTVLSGEALNLERGILNRFVGVVSVVAGGASVYGMMIQHYPVALMYHVVAALLGGMAASGRSPGDIRKHYFEWVTALFVPCIGGPAVWIIIQASVKAPKANLVDEYANYIVPTGSSASQAAHYVAPTPANVEPIAHILNANAAEWEKRNAIEALLRLETPESVALLRSVLKRGSAEVKIYAASALSRLDERLSVRLNVLKKKLKKVDNSEKGTVHLILAQVYLDYIYFNMIDGIRRTEYIDAAVSHASSAWTLIEDPAALLMAARAHLKKQQYDEALSHLALYLDIVPDDQQALFLQAETCFLLEDYRSVQTICHQLEAMDDLPDAMRETTKLWV